MRKLITIGLVITFVAVGAAVAIPNLLESRIDSQEAAAATALKSGIVPAEVEFQAGAYLDQDHNNLGEYATATGLGPGKSYLLMSGGTSGGVTLNLLDPTYHSATPLIRGYRFTDPISEISSQERVWGAIAQPASAEDGRRVFAINQAGNIYVCPVTDYNATPKATDPDLFGVSLVSAAVGNAGYDPQRRLQMIPGSRR